MDNPASRIVPAFVALTRLRSGAKLRSMRRLLLVLAFVAALAVQASARAGGGES